MVRSLFLCGGLSLATLASAQLTPTRLRCEYRENPIGLDVTVPRLSWIDESGNRGARQSGFRIEVASTPQLLAKGKADLWDSGRLASSQSTLVEYKGTELKSGQRAYWRVTVWDSEQKKPRTSESAYWQMALLKPSDWKAKWVSMPRDPDIPASNGRAGYVWYPEGHPERDAPVGKRYFRYRFDLPNSPIRHALLGFAADDRVAAKINGQPLVEGVGWRSFAAGDAKEKLHPGQNEIEVAATNDAGRAGLLVVGTIELANGQAVDIGTDASWATSIDAKNWRPALPIDGASFGPTIWASLPKPAPYLRKAFELRGRVTRATAYVAARGLFRLSIDGKRVGNDDLAPGWTDFNKRIQYLAYDVTPMLGNGEHALGLVLGDGWYAGNIGNIGRGNYGQQPMGLAQVEIEYADGHRETVATDETWKIATGPILMNDLQTGEMYDARLAMTNWDRPGFDDSHWQTPQVRERDEVPLVAKYGPTVQKLDELSAQKITEPTPGTYVVDLGQNMVGWARLRARGKAGEKIRLRFAEMLNPDGTVYTANLRSAKATDTYMLSGKGEEVYEPTFTFHGFRYVEVTGYPGKLPKDAITGIVVGTNSPQTGTFECSNPLANQLWHNVYWGQRGNYLEVPTDCPQRDERLGWMGDAQIFARTATYNNDVAGFLTKWTQDVVDAQSPEGAFADVSPRMGVPDDGAPAWGDAGVIVPWTVYLAYGDRRILEQRYDAMKAWIGYIDAVNPDHTWRNRRSNDFGDWLNVQDDTPRDVLATAYYAYCTDIVAKAATVLGKTEDAAQYRQLREEIGKAFVDAFVDPDTTVVKGDTQTAYVLALHFNLLPVKKRAAAAKRLVDHILIDRNGHLSTGFVGVGYLNPTLTDVGRLDVAYQLLLNDTYPSWGYSIRQGATTIWERWDGWTQEKGFQDPAMNSFNHYSLGSVAEWMYRTVLGIDTDPEAPGYEKIVIHPLPGGDLKWARGSVDTPHGKVSTAWSVSKKRFELNVTIPANTTASVYVPSEWASDVKHNEAGVRFLRTEGDSTVFEVGGGQYRFYAERH